VTAVAPVGSCVTGVLQLGGVAQVEEQEEEEQEEEAYFIFRFCFVLNTKSENGALLCVFVK
jgi:hypothetical protein